MPHPVAPEPRAKDFTLELTTVLGPPLALPRCGPAVPALGVSRGRLVSDPPQQSSARSTEGGTKVFFSQYRHFEADGEYASGT